MTERIHFLAHDRDAPADYLAAVRSSKPGPGGAAG